MAVLPFGGKQMFVGTESPTTPLDRHRRSSEPDSDVLAVVMRLNVRGGAGRRDPVYRGAGSGVGA